MTSGPVESYGYEKPAGFRVGAALSRAFRVLFGNFVTIYAIGMLAALPLGLLLWLDAGGVRSGTSLLITIGLSLPLSGLSQAMIVFATFQTLRARPVTPAESIRRGSARFGPVVAASVLLGIVTMLGFFLLIVPGIIWTVMLYVTLPACVVERLGPSESFSRSSVLTRGFRWPIFGVVAVVAIIEIVVNQIIFAWLGHAVSWLAFVIVYVLWIALVRAYDSVLVTIVYHDLRVAKEGIDLDRIASVFD
jgi:hypothetical protein